MDTYLHARQCTAGAVGPGNDGRCRPACQLQSASPEEGGVVGGAANGIHSEQEVVGEDHGEHSAAGAHHQSACRHWQVGMEGRIAARQWRALWLIGLGGVTDQQAGCADQADRGRDTRAGSSSLDVGTSLSTAAAASEGEKQALPLTDAARVLHPVDGDQDEEDGLESKAPPLEPAAQQRPLLPQLTAAGNVWRVKEPGIKRGAVAPAQKSSPHFAPVALRADVVVEAHVLVAGVAGTLQ